MNLKRNLFNYIFLILAIFSFSSVVNAVGTNNDQNFVEGGTTSTNGIYSKAKCVYDFTGILYGRDDNTYITDRVTINLEYVNGELVHDYDIKGLDTTRNLQKVNDIIYSSFTDGSTLKCPNYLVQHEYEINEVVDDVSNIKNDFFSGYSYGSLVEWDYSGEEVAIDDIRKCNYAYEKDGTLQYETEVSFNLTKQTVSTIVKGHNGNSSEIILINKLVFEDYESDTCPTAYLSFNTENTWYGNLILSKANPNITPDFVESFGAKVSVLVNPLNAMNDMNLKKLADQYITAKNIKIDWETTYASNYICDIDKCKEDPFYYFAESIVFLRDYCKTVYSKDNATNIKDCINFEKFYSKVVEQGYFSDYTSGCVFVTNDLKDKLIFVLDLIKIAGPIIAIGLGTLDFIKVLASGDAAGEMKKSFKRFMIRILAAILLFIIPVIISFMLDIFLEEQEGYNSDNPFCNLIDMGE